MKKLIVLTFIIAFIISCTHHHKVTDKMLVLQTDSVNRVKLTDSLVIFASTCRGCEYEKSTRFDIYDSLGIIKLMDVITTDNNPDNVDGGNINKDLVLKPIKTGFTSIRVYKFWSDKTASKDSANYTAYTIDVRN